MVRRLVVALMVTISTSVMALPLAMPVTAAGSVTIRSPGGKQIQIPADQAQQQCDLYYNTRSAPAGGIRPGFDADKVCPQVNSTPPPTIIQRAAGAAAQGVADTTSNWVVDGATTALGWLNDALSSKRLEPDWGLVGPVYNHMLAFALALVVALVGVTLLERMAGGVQGAGLSIVVRVVYAVVLAVLALPLLAYANGILEQLSDGWGTVFGHSTSDMVTNLSKQLHDGSAGNGALLAVVALVALIGAVGSVAWLVLRVALVQGLAIWLPLAAVLSISPRLSGLLRRLGEFLASIVLAKLVMVITLATAAAFITAGVFDHDWMQVISGAVLLVVTATEPFLLLGFLHWMQPYMLGRGHGFAREALATGVGSGLGAYEGVRWGVRHVQRFDAERSREERQRTERGAHGGAAPSSRPGIGGGTPPTGSRPDGGTEPVGRSPHPVPPNAPPPIAGDGPPRSAPTNDGEKTP